MPSGGTFPVPGRRGAGGLVRRVTYVLPVRAVTAPRHIWPELFHDANARIQIAVVVIRERNSQGRSSIHIPWTVRIICFECFGNYCCIDVEKIAYNSPMNPISATQN